MSDYIKRNGAESGVGYVGIDNDYFVSVKEVLNITAETGALETQDRVRDLSPADVEPVRHGQWIRESVESVDSSDGCFKIRWAECSECGTRVIGKPNYCPYCGAKMNEKEQDCE